MAFLSLVIMLGGYGAGYELLFRPVAGGAALHPVTSVALLLLALGTLAKPSFGKSNLSRAFYGAALALAACRLIDIHLAWHVLDQFPLGQGMLREQAARGTPITFGENTAIAIAITAMAGLSQSVVRTTRQAFYAALALIIPAISLTGYAYRLPSFYGQMSTYTTLLLTGIVASMLLSLGHRGAMKMILGRSTVATMLRPLLLGSIALPFFGGLAVNYGLPSTQDGLALLIVFLAFGNCVLLLRAAHLANIFEQVQIRQARELVTERLLGETRRMEREWRTSIDDFSAGLAHNLNNLMVPILNSADRVCEELPPGHPLIAVAQRGLQATEQAAALTRLMSISGGHSYIARGRADVDATVALACETLRRAVGSRYEIACNLAAPGMTIGVTKSVLSEALQALIANAQQAMPNGGLIRMATVLATGTNPADPRIVTISVTDSGSGMDGETLRRAKEPFFTTREIGQGVGLGLSFVDGTARIAGGTLSLTSAVGTGTTAILRLPALLE
ncbi:hypothetical protein BH11PSE3_BH11PSE3_49930 [soil metagenome]